MGNTDGLGNANVARPQGRGGEPGECASQQPAGAGGTADGLADTDSGHSKLIARNRSRPDEAESRRASSGPTGCGENGWQSIEWLPCADGKARPTQPGIHPLADGLPGRVGQLRAYGNAIVPSLAAEFVRAFMECQA